MSSKSLSDVIEAVATAYDYVIEHRVRLLGESEAHMAEMSDSGAEV